MKTISVKSSKTNASFRARYSFPYGEKGTIKIEVEVDGQWRRSDEFYEESEMTILCTWMSGDVECVLRAVVVPDEKLSNIIKERCARRRAEKEQQAADKEAQMWNY